VDDYRGKRVVVTGATSGIGAALVAALRNLGADVVPVGRRRDHEGVVQADLSDPASIRSAVEEIGRADRLINCAGALPMSPGAEILKVNFLGARLLTELLVPTMSEGGSIVNVSSDGGYAWRTQRALILEFIAVGEFEAAASWYAQHEQQAGHAYSFSKSALDVWTMQQAQVLISRGIRINTVSPGAVQTPMLEQIEAVFPAEMIAATEVPSGRRSTPDEQVGPILFLGSDGASYVNGADLAVDGGYWASLSLQGALW
jgi:NAD(P)-dependent dehydrogenase (short-subunit alcohol dehydrogenase family)